MEILVEPLFCMLLYVQYLFTARIKVTFELHIKKLSMNSNWEEKAGKSGGSHLTSAT